MVPLIFAAVFAVTSETEPQVGDPPRPTREPLVFDEDRLPICMRGARDELAPNIVKLTVHRFEVNDKGERQFTSLDVTGVLVDAKRGEIVTYGKALEGADRVAVRFVGAHDCRPRRTTVVGVDVKRGIGLVRAGKMDLPGLRRGEPGEDLGPVFLTSFRDCEEECDTSSTTGVAQGRVTGQDVGAEYDSVIRLAVVGCEHRGPGGLVSTADGRLVGLELPAAEREKDEEQVVRLAVPMSQVWAAVDHVRKAEKRPKEGPLARRAPRPWIGIGCEPLEDKTLLHHLGIEGGILVEDVYVDSPAEKAGVQPHFVLVEWNGKSLRTMKDLAESIRDSEVGDTIALTVFKCGVRRELALVLGEW